MRQPRIKCARCGMIRIAAKHISERKINITSRKIGGYITFFFYQPICNQCDSEIYDILSNALWERI